jgi:hypothetical protein
MVNVLTLAEPGDRCYSSTIQGGKYDLLGNVLTCNLKRTSFFYSTPIIPTFSKGLPVLRWSEAPYYVSKEMTDIEELFMYRRFKERYGFEIVDYAIQLREYMRMRFTDSFAWQQYRYIRNKGENEKRQIEYWAKNRGYSRWRKPRVTVYTLKSDSIDFCHLGDDISSYSAPIQAFIVKLYETREDSMLLVAGSVCVDLSKVT